MKNNYAMGKIFQSQVQSSLQFNKQNTIQWKEKKSTKLISKVMNPGVFRLQRLLNKFPTLMEMLQLMLSWNTFFS